jgi:hypothetical protein
MKKVKAKQIYPAATTFGYFLMFMFLATFMRALRCFAFFYFYYKISGMHLAIGLKLHPTSEYAGSTKRCV